MNTEDIVNDVLTHKLNFKKLTPSEQSFIRKNRCKPELDIQHNEHGTWRKFNIKWYDDFPWLTGSKTRSQLFCIACTIYGGDPSWSYEGIDSIKKFVDRANKHETLRSHLKSMESYIMAGKTKKLRDNTDDVKKINEETSRKEVLSKIIDSVIILNQHGKSLEVFSSQHKYSLGEVVLKKYLCDESVYRRIYEEVKEDLVKTMESQLYKDIKKEISQTEYCSILVDKIPSMDNEYSVLVRYVHDGSVKERFVGFYKIVKIFDLAQIFNTVTGDVRKAVCHSYDGTPTLKPLRQAMKPIMPKLLFLPNHFHKLSSVILQNLEGIEEVRPFMRDVTFICDFFKSPNRAHYLTIYGLNFPLESETLWKFHSKAIHSILTQHNRILKIINNIILEPYVIDLETVNLAHYIQKTLRSSMFLMIGNLFTKVFAHIDHLSNIIQKKLLDDVRFCLQEIKQTIRNISNLKASICLNQKYEDVSQEDIKNFKITVAKVVHNITVHLSDIYEDTKFLRFVEIIDGNKFSTYWNKFPKAMFTETMEFYQSFFNLVRLENELMTVYSDPAKQLSPLQLFHYLYDNDLTETYKETYKLLKLYLTYPLIPVSNATSCRWTKLKKFVNNPRNKNKSAMLFLEAYEKNTTVYANFKDKVIQDLDHTIVISS